MKHFDNTRLKDYKDCPRRFYLRHIKGWRKQGLSAPLAFGLAWHEAMNVVWAGYNKLNKDDLIALAFDAFNTSWVASGMPAELSLEQVARLKSRVPNTAYEMLVNYVEVRKDVLTHAEVIAIEAPFSVPLDESGSVHYIGKLDKVFRYNGDKIIGEHKTTSEYKIDGGFKEEYLESWFLDSQVTGYNYSGNLFYENVRYVWVDAALVHLKVHDKFKFIPVSHQYDMMDAWLHDTRKWISEIQDDMAEPCDPTDKYMRSFRKNTEACTGKYGQCAFMDICRSRANPAALSEPPEGYLHEPWEPFSILKLSKEQQS